MFSIYSFCFVSSFSPPDPIFFFGGGQPYFNFLINFEQSFVNFVSLVKDSTFGFALPLYYFFLINTVFICLPCQTLSQPRSQAAGEVHGKHHAGPAARGEERGWGRGGSFPGERGGTGRRGARSGPSPAWRRGRAPGTVPTAAQSQHPAQSHLRPQPR